MHKLITHPAILLPHACSVTQSCLTLCDPTDYRPPGSSVHGILQVRILKWVAISSSRGSSEPRDRIQVSCIGGWILHHRATCEPLPSLHWPLKMLCQNPLRILGLFWVGTTHFPCMTLQQTFLCSKLQHGGLFGLTVYWAHKPVFSNTIRNKSWRNKDEKLH